MDPLRDFWRLSLKMSSATPIKARLARNPITPAKIVKISISNCSCVSASSKIPSWPLASAPANRSVSSTMRYDRGSAVAGLGCNEFLKLIPF